MIKTVAELKQQIQSGTMPSAKEIADRDSLAAAQSKIDAAKAEIRRDEAAAANIARRVERLAETKDAFLELHKADEKATALFKNLVAIVDQIFEHGSKRNAVLSQLAAVFRDEKKRPTEGLPELGYRWSADERGMTIDGVSMGQIDYSDRIDQLTAFAIGKHIPTHGPFLGLQPEVRAELEANF